MSVFKYRLIAIHNWNSPVTEQCISQHKTIDQAIKMLKVNENQSLDSYKRSMKKGAKDYSINTYRIEEIN